jgi:hypothetical protein
MVVFIGYLSGGILQLPKSGVKPLRSRYPGNAKPQLGERLFIRDALPLPSWGSALRALMKP